MKKLRLLLLVEYYSHIGGGSRVRVSHIGGGSLNDIMDVSVDIGRVNKSNSGTWQLALRE